MDDLAPFPATNPTRGRARPVALASVLEPLTGHRIRLLLTNGDEIAGIVNTPVWHAGEIVALHLVDLDPLTELATLTVPWHAVAGIGRELEPRRPRARGDE